MITFIDEKGTEHSALVAYSVTNAVNGELSVKGTIYTNDKVLHGIDRGWRFRLDDEYYRVTYAKPNDTGRQIEVEFDAVHQFFYDMSKSVVYDTLNGSKPFETYLQAIFSGSGYTYNLETTVGSIRKENFGNKSRLSLFNDIIKAAGLEFSVRGHVVRILKRIGTDLSAIVRKNFNMNELKIEKNINSFVTYQRGLGAWKDDEDHSKGRYESEYESPLAKIYGRIEAEPVVDERYKETGKLLERLKENVDKSYKVSVEIDMEDLSRAGYRLSRPNPGDYIMAINETLGFSQKVRIVSFTSEYDVGGNLISRKVVCNDIGSVQRRASEMSSLARSVQDVAAENAKAIATATKALVSADGKNTIYFSESKPRDEPVGTLRKGDQLYLKEGEKTNLYFWNGAEWELNPLEMDIVKFRKEYESKTKEINQSLATQTQQTAQALRTAGANASAIEAAKGAITKLNHDLTSAKQTNQAAIDRLKSDFASAQKAANDQTALLRSDLANIRTQQTQAESEIAKQVAALNATKTELAGVKTAQATFEQSTTRRLAELSNVADGKASKSELTQTAEELKSRIASVQTGSSRNYFRNSRSRSFTTNEQPTYDYRLFIVPGFWQNKDRLKRDYVRLSFDVTFPVALARDTQANVHFSAHPWYSYTGLVFKGGTTERQHFEFTIDLSGAAETYQTNNVFIRFGTNYGFPAGLQIVIENAMLSIGNYYPAYQPAYEDQDERVSAVESSFKQKADSLEAGVNRLTEGLKTKADSSALTVLSDRISASVKSLETDTQNKLNQKLSTTEFDVRASGIRQEIVNATKDKADKALVTAEAGRLREELVSLQAYVNADGTRSEALLTQSREETARQLTAERKLIEAGYVAKAQHTEDVRSISRRFEELKSSSEAKLAEFRQGIDGQLATVQAALNTANNSLTSFNTWKQSAQETLNKVGKVETGLNETKTSLAEFKRTAEGQLSTITQQVAGKASQTDFQRVQETSKLYERLIGSTENEITDKVSRMVMTNQLFQTEVGKYVTDDNNLIVNSMTMATNTFVNANRNGVEITLNDGVFSIKARGLTSYNFSGFTLPIYVKKIYRGETYTLGFKYRIREKVDTNFVFVVKNHKLNKGLLSADLADPNTLASAEWREFQRTFTVKEDFLFGEDLNYPFYIYMAKNGWVEFKEPILVRGSKTGPYKPSQFDDAYRSSGEAKELASNAQAKAIQIAQGVEAVRTQVTQLNNSYSIRNLNNAGDVLGQLNLNPDGSIRINEGLLSIGEKTYIKDGVIKNAMIESMLADKITAGTLNAANVNIVNLNANKIVGLDANFIKSKIELALVDWLKGKVITAQNDAMKIDLNNGQYNVMTDQAAIRRVLSGYPNQFLKFTSETEGGAPASVTVLGANRDGTENSKNDSFAGIRLYSGNKVERTEIISDVVRFATGAVNYRGWEMRTLYGNDNRQVILQPFGNVTRSNIVANYFNGIDLVNVLETLNQMMANLGNHTGRHDIFGPIRGVGARKYVR